MKNKLQMMIKLHHEELMLYERKSEDYGEIPMEVTGIVGLIVRIADKIHRVLNLSKNGRVALVEDENLEDTLRDISNYANMALIELEIKKREGKQT